MVATAGADRSLRVWQRTEEPFFVEEEKEKRLESLFEADLEVPAALPHSSCWGCQGCHGLFRSLTCRCGVQYGI